MMSDFLPSMSISKMPGCVHEPQTNLCVPISSKSPTTISVWISFGLGISKSSSLTVSAGMSSSSSMFGIWMSSKAKSTAQSSSVGKSQSFAKTSASQVPNDTLSRIYSRFFSSSVSEDAVRVQLSGISVYPSSNRALYR